MKILNDLMFINGFYMFCIGVYLKDKWRTI